MFDTNTIIINFDVHYNFWPINLLLTGKKIKGASIRIYAGMASFDSNVMQCAQSIRANSDNSSDLGTSGRVLQLMKTLRDNCNSGKATLYPAKSVWFILPVWFF